MDEDRPTADTWPQCPRCGTHYDHGAQYCQRDGARLVTGGEVPDRYLGRVLLDQFRIDEVLGTGGMGTVYRARQPSLDRDVAIKILHAELADHPDAVRRFQREARVATALDHRNVVRVLLLGQLPDGSPYLVMEHVPGRSLGQVLRHEGPLPLHRALHIAIQVADAVGEAHAHGIVHRDVKPENVMVVRHGADADFVKVLDFGIARLLWDEHTVATQSGVIFGTARYISPEGASGEATDARSDVYSIGVLAYQLIAGATPFEGTTPVTLLLKHVNDPVPDIRERVRCPDPVADVVMQALRKRPGDRFEDAKALAMALRDAAARCSVRVAGHDADTSGAEGLPANVRRRPRLGTGAILLLAFVLGAGAVTAGGLLVGWMLRGDAVSGREEQVEERAEDDPVRETTASEGAEGETVAREEVTEATASQPEKKPPRRRERKRAAPPVTTIHPGRSGDAWQPPVLAPAVDARDEEGEASEARAPEDPEADGPGAGDGSPSTDVETEHTEGRPEPEEPEGAPEPEEEPEAPPPPWTGTVL